MPTLTISEINDLATVTRPRESLGQMNDIASQLTKYEFTKYMLAEDKITYQGGTSIKGNEITDENGSAQMIGMFATIEPNITDVMAKFDVPWRHMNSNWSYERKEILVNANGKTLTQVMNILDARRIPARISEAALLEAQWWTNTPDPNSETDLYGIKYWVTKSATRGFNGVEFSGFSDVAGLATSTYPRWKNYTAQYTDETEQDLLHEMNLAADETDFVPPVDMEEFKRGIGKNNRIYLNLTTKTNLEQEMRSRNDRHSSLSDFANATSFRNSTLRYVPKLNDDTDNPVYMLDMNYLFVVCLEGDEMFEHPPMNDVETPDTYTVHRFSTLNPVCTNRRVQAVIKKQ